MIRLLGALTGSALALATLLVVIGMPQFRTEHTANVRAIDRLPLPTMPVEQGDVRSVAAAEPAEDDTAGYASERADPDDPADPPQHDAATAGTEPLSPAAGDGTADIGSAAAAVPPALDTPQSWYAFWSPFRSELAANGFVARLQSVTGLDYRVVRLKPGVYEVAFAYETDADIAAKLTQITAATGLELPE